MKKIITINITMFTVIIAMAQQSLQLLPVSDDLKKNAHSVIREMSTTLDIKSISRSYQYIHEVVTVLDEMGKGRLFFIEYADKFHSLEDVSIQLLDANGSSIKKYSKKDLTSVNTGDGLVTDGKYYYLTISTATFPVTVRYDYEIKYDGSLDYPGFDVQQPEQSVQNSSFRVIVPPSLDIRFKARNTNLTPVITSDKSNKIYTWTALNVPALRYEEESVSAESRYPKIIIAPNKFELDGYEGDMTSWEKFGEWYGALAKKSINLTEERKQFFKALVKDASTDVGKAAIIYKYLQQNFRYVSIQLGIGGYKPFEASFTDKNKYGDCKALSNYTQACLDAVGIKSYQALINAKYNKEPVDPSFPYNGFNHVILCMPTGKDSVWLECTSNTNEFGVLGNFTENRNALLITETGGKLVATPKSKAVHNKFSTHCIVTLNEDGSGGAKVELKTTGEFKTYLITKEKQDDQKKYIVNRLGFIQPDDFSLTEKNEASSEYLLELAFEKIPAFTTGNKMFLNPRIYRIWSISLPNAANRTQDFYFPHPFVKEDTTTYMLPAGYSMEALPETKDVKFDYGRLLSKYSYDKDKNELQTTIHLELNNYHIPFANYEKTKAFFDAVLAEYNGKIVITKN